MLNVAFGNATDTPPARWRAEPSTRGTWNILSSCLITLSLCLWTALHLNVPRHKEGVWRAKMRKTGWLLLGLLAPEMIAYTAWHQRRAVYKLDAVMKRKLGQQPGHSCNQSFIASFFTRCCPRGRRGAGRDTKDVELDDLGSLAATRRHRWTIVHSFYANMGGFVFDTSHEDINFLPNSRQRLTLTPRGLLFLLEHEPNLIPDISKEHICDKSKASNLAKTLVCLQALWFCVQCIVRLAQGLTLSLLELNVFGHAICALLMYLLWWDKPLDIEEPTVMSGNSVREMCALMCMRTFPSDPGDFFFNKTWVGTGHISYARPELPYGVKYGSTHMCNMIETSLDSGYFGRTKWYRIDKLYVWILINVYYDCKNYIHDVMVHFGYREPRPGPRRFIDCRLHWAVTGSGEQLERTSQDGSYPVDLNYPDDNLGAEDRTRRHSPLPDSITTTNCIDGLCLTLGEWNQKGADIFADGFVARKPQPDYAPTSVTLSRGDIIRWRLCARALQLYCPQPKWCRLTSGKYSHQEFPALHSVYDRSPDFPSSLHLRFSGKSNGQSWAIVFGFSFAGLVYGGLHLLAWNAPFPTQFQRMFWRGSGVLLISSGFIYILSILVVRIFFSARDWIVRMPLWGYLNKLLGPLFKPLSDIVGSVCNFAAYFLMSLFGVTYAAARGYLVVESFIQLVHLPDSAYTLPGWSQYYPHIS